MTSWKKCEAKSCTKKVRIKTTFPDTPRLCMKHQAEKLYRPSVLDITNAALKKIGADGVKSPFDFATKPHIIGVDYAKGHDPVNHPAHYTQGGIECIDAIRAALTEEEFRGFCKGNMIKYTWRERHKGGDESLKKGEFYSRQLTKTPAV